MRSGSITIKSVNKRDYIQVDIIDTGVGIRKLEIPKLFNKFYQVQSHLTRTQTGTGLGLPIVKEIVGLHHGLLSVKSKPGNGTTIGIMLPKQQPADGGAGQQLACWEEKVCRKIKCPAYNSTDKRCWLYMGTLCKKNSNEPCLDKIDVCTYCSIYKKAKGETDAKEKEEKKDNPNS